MKKSSIFLMAFSLLLFVSFASNACEEMDFVLPRHTPNEIIKNITPLVNEKEIQIVNYVLTNISYDYIKRRWHLSYQGKSLGVGDHFSVVVDDNLEEIKIVPGL